MTRVVPSPVLPFFRQGGQRGSRESCIPLENGPTPKSGLHSVRSLQYANFLLQAKNAADDWCVQTSGVAKGGPGRARARPKLASFSGLLRLQFLIACILQAIKNCILQAIKSWSRRRPGNEATCRSCHAISCEREANGLAYIGIGQVPGQYQ